MSVLTHTHTTRPVSCCSSRQNYSWTYAAAWPSLSAHTPISDQFLASKYQQPTITLCVSMAVCVCVCASICMCGWGERRGEKEPVWLWVCIYLHVFANGSACVNECVEWCWWRRGRCSLGSLNLNRVWFPCPASKRISVLFHHLRFKVNLPLDPSWSYFQFPSAHFHSMFNLYFLINTSVD